MPTEEQRHRIEFPQEGPNLRIILVGSRRHLVMEARQWGKPADSMAPILMPVGREGRR